MFGTTAQSSARPKLNEVHVSDRRSPSRWFAFAAATTLLSAITVGSPFSAGAGAAKFARVAAPAVPPDLPVDPPASVPIQAIETLVGAAPAVVEPEAPAPPASTPCAEALAWVEAAGLMLPSGIGYRCPSTEFAHHGAACWNAFVCPGTGFIAINTDRMQGTSTEYLHHVVAHEICHIVDFQGTGRSSEAGADACAAAHGAPA